MTPEKAEFRIGPQVAVLDDLQLDQVNGGVLPLVLWGGVVVGTAAAAWVGHNAYQLVSTYNGWSTPDPSSRLGVVADTKDYPWGTLGAAVNVGTAALYAVLGPAGQQTVGEFFSRPEVQELLPQPTNSPASLALATAEYTYWQSQAGTFGGFLGTAFSPEARDVAHQILGNLGSNPNAPTDQRTQGPDDESIQLADNQSGQAIDGQAGQGVGEPGDGASGYPIDYAGGGYDGGVPQESTDYYADGSYE